MPIYQYHCTSCGADLEIFQHMTDPTLETCPECQGHLRKIFSPVGIVFKGSGFYATASRKTSITSNPPASVPPHSGDTKPSATPAEPAAPAATPAPSPAPASASTSTGSAAA